MMASALNQEQEIRDRILSASEQLFFRKGTRAVSMDEIAGYLGISKKTLYHHFSDKDKLVLELMEQKLREEETNVCLIDHISTNAVQWFFVLMNKMKEMFDRINPVLFYDLQKYHPSSWKLFLDFKENCIRQSVADVIERGKTEGLIRQDVNTEILAHFRTLQIDMLFNPESFPPDKFNMTLVQTALMEHFLYGICTLKGYQLINKYKQNLNEE
jgi:AcrR family transcriptional regulator